MLNKKIFCSITDEKYLDKFMALFASLEEQEGINFKHYVVCLDQVTFLVLNKLNKSQLILVKPEELMKQDYELWNARQLQPSREAVSNGQSQGKDPTYIQFCWLLSSYMCNKLLEYYHEDHVMYIDADLYFYKPLNDIYEEIGDKSIGIVRHRIDYLEGSGEYNVGIVYFKNNGVGRKCLAWWGKQMLNPGNPYYFYYGTCGDQKYLELFEPLFGQENVCVIDKNIGHLAPWNVYSHKYLLDQKRIIWNDVQQELYFFHFAHVVPDYNNNTYRTSYRNEWMWGIPENCNNFIKNLYDEYMINLIKQHNLIIEKGK
jgi:hypothetical protein